MKRKLFSLSAAALMTCTLLGGLTSCNSAPLDPEFIVPEKGFDTSKKVTINFYHTMGKNLQEVFDAYLEDFNEIYPNIEVKTTSIGGYDDVRDQMTTELSSKKRDGANVAYCYPDHVAMYNKAKAVIQLDNLINSDDPDIGLSDATVNDFIDAYYNEGKCFGDGKMYSLPFSKSSEVLYYNKTFLDAHNLQVPTHWFTKDEADVTSMEYVCKEIKKVNSDVIPLGYDSAANWFITMCEQMGAPYTSATGENFLFNNDKAKDFVSKFVEWRKNGLITTKSILGTYTSSEFQQKNLIMCIGSSAGAGYQVPEDHSFETGIAAIPQETEHKAVIQQGPSVCIFNTKDKQKVLASWLFVKYFTTTVDFQAEFSLTSGYTPVIKSVENNSTYTKELASANTTNHVQAAAINQCLAQKDMYFVSPAFVGSSVARDQAEFLFTECLEGKNINTTFADAIAKCEYAVK